jgi:hypothetical protein
MGKHGGNSYNQNKIFIPAALYFRISIWSIGHVRRWDREWAIEVIINLVNAALPTQFLLHTIIAVGSAIHGKNVGPAVNG